MLQPPNNHQLWRYVNAVVLCRPICVSVNSVTSWPCDEMTGSLYFYLQHTMCMSNILDTHTVKHGLYKPRLFHFQAAPPLSWSAARCSMPLALPQSAVDALQKSAYPQHAHCVFPIPRCVRCSIVTSRLYEMWIDADRLFDQDVCDWFNLVTVSCLLI